MPHPDTVERFIARVLQGAHAEAIEEYYTEQASMRENFGAARQGRALLVENERRVLAQMRSVRSDCVRPVFINGDQVVIRWIFEFESLSGRRSRLEELAYQRWEGERIAEEQFFYDPEQLQAGAACATAPELLVGYWKVGSGQPSLSWSESVDEALCFGWIDGVRKRIDDASYQIRFTPRRPGSIWSAVNLAKVETLIAAGRMQPAGLAVYEARDPAKQRVYAFEREQPAELSAAELKQFRAQRKAWAYFERCPPGYRNQMLHRICSAKRADTRARRLAQLMEVCGRGERMV